MTQGEKIAISVLFTTIMALITARPVIDDNRLRLGVLAVTFIVIMCSLSFVKTKEEE